MTLQKNFLEFSGVIGKYITNYHCPGEKAEIGVMQVEVQFFTAAVF